MEIGLPTNVMHVAHVTFDRFNGFLGLPAEFEPEIPRKPPSASTSVFGVSTKSMQLSFDSRGNSVPIILLLMQDCLYAQGGLQAEGIFRINAENGQEELIRGQLNKGVVPDGVDVHCLAGLIKAWFRELPNGILDSLSSEQVMKSHSEEECGQLARLLPPTEAALLNWAVNLMVDVVQLEHLNKMNARNVAMVFAPNMTRMADPLTALMYAVAVMNFLQSLIVRTLKERTNEASSVLHGEEPSHDNGQPFLHGFEGGLGNVEEQVPTAKAISTMETGPPKDPTPDMNFRRGLQETALNVENQGSLKHVWNAGNGKGKKVYKKMMDQPVENTKGGRAVNRLNSPKAERFGVWR